MNYREYIGKVGLKNISKEELVSKIEYLYELIESNRHSYQELIRDRDNKIESLIKEKNAYQQLYLDSKQEIKNLKDKNKCYQTINILSTQLKKAHEQLDKLERDKKELEVQLYDMKKMRDNWKADHDYQYECFCAERERRQELEKIICTSHKIKDKGVKIYLESCRTYNKLFLYIDDIDEVELLFLGVVDWNTAPDDYRLITMDSFYDIRYKDGIIFRVSKLTKKVVDYRL